MVIKEGNTVWNFFHSRHNVDTAMTPVDGIRQ